MARSHRGIEFRHLGVIEPHVVASVQVDPDNPPSLADGVPHWGISASLLAIVGVLGVAPLAMAAGLRRYAGLAHRHPCPGNRVSVGTHVSALAPPIDAGHVVQSYRVSFAGVPED